MAQSTNTFILTGNVVRKPEIKKVSNDKDFCYLTLAVNRAKKGECDFISIALWEEKAVNANKYLDKGSIVSVLGHIASYPVEDNGNKTTKYMMVGESMTFLSSSKKSEKKEESAAPSNPFSSEFQKVTSDPFIPFT